MPSIPMTNMILKNKFHEDSLYIYHPKTDKVKIRESIILYLKTYMYILKKICNVNCFNFNKQFIRFNLSERTFAVSMKNNIFSCYKCFLDYFGSIELTNCKFYLNNSIVKVFRLTTSDSSYYENIDVFINNLRSITGSYRSERKISLTKLPKKIKPIQIIHTIKHVVYIDSMASAQKLSKNGVTP